MSRTSTTGFLDLPLEIRQQIYRECLPQTIDGDYLAQLPGKSDDRLHEIREAMPQLGTEIWDEWRMSCVTMCFRVTATKWDPPPLMSLPKLGKLFVEFEELPNGVYICCPHPECYCSKDLDMRARGERTLATMYFNVSRFITWLKQSSIAQHIKYLDIKFLGCDTDCPSWYFKLYEVRHDDYTFEYTDELLGLRLTTRTAANGREVSVIESLLMPFQDFPCVPTAHVSYFGPRDEDHEWDDPVESEKFRKLGTEFDGYYADELTLCWQLWLEGMRHLPWRRFLYHALWYRTKLLHEDDVDEHEDDGEDTDEDDTDESDEDEDDVL